jgi:hypothetical protein
MQSNTAVLSMLAQQQTRAVQRRSKTAWMTAAALRRPRGHRRRLVEDR